MNSYSNKRLFKNTLYPKTQVIPKILHFLGTGAHAVLHMLEVTFCSSLILCHTCDEETETKAHMKMLRLLIGLILFWDMYVNNYLSDLK